MLQRIPMILMFVTIAMVIVLVLVGLVKWSVAREERLVREGQIQILSVSELGNGPFVWVDISDKSATDYAEYEKASLRAQMAKSYPDYVIRKVDAHWRPNKFGLRSNVLDGWLLEIEQPTE